MFKLQHSQLIKNVYIYVYIFASFFRHVNILAIRQSEKNL